MIKVLSFGYIKDLLTARHELLSASGFEVTSLETKNAVVRKLESQAYDVLLIGHGVPIQHRTEVARKAKCLNKIPIIFLYHWNINKAEYADAVLSVDGCVEHLLETIRRIASEAKAQAPPQRKKRFFNLG
jgi:DNA-binding NtrC family response regulator